MFREFNSNQITAPTSQLRMSVHLNCPVYSTPTLAITIIFTQGSICPRPKPTEGIMFEIKSNNYDRK